MIIKKTIAKTTYVVNGEYSTQARETAPKLMLRLILSDLKNNKNITK